MKKIKLLVVSDDIRVISGVAIQCNKLLTGLNRTGKYDIVQIAGSLVRQPPTPIMFNGIKLYPTSDGYGNPALLREVTTLEKPDIILFMSDPRFFEYAFLMDNELRKSAKTILYHTWDNDPFPYYNLPWYSACDEIVMISEFSYNLMKTNGVECTHIPHGIDPTEFYPLTGDQVAAHRNYIISQAKCSDIDFIVFWNNRNINRKRGADIIYYFKEFSKTYSNSLLFINSNPHDPEGPNLLDIIDDLNITDSPIVINTQRVNSEILNTFYNAADLTINIANNEGFGLCVSESLCSGTPVIATRTGGMPEQMFNPVTKEIYGKLLTPAVRSLYGNPLQSYIYQDYCSQEQVLEALSYAYNNSKEWKELGEKGREFTIANFHIEDIIKKWDKLLENVVGKSSKYEPYKISEGKAL